jgi:hypothetical protein
MQPDGSYRQERSTAESGDAAAAGTHATLMELTRRRIATT